jgi:hypothetical protein
MKGLHISRIAARSVVVMGRCWSRWCSLSVPSAGVRATWSRLVTASVLSGPVRAIASQAGDGLYLSVSMLDFGELGVADLKSGVRGLLVSVFGRGTGSRT